MVQVVPHSAAIAMNNEIVHKDLPLPRVALTVGLPTSLRGVLYAYPEPDGHLRFRMSIDRNGKRVSDDLLEPRVVPVGYEISRDVQNMVRRFVALMSEAAATEPASDGPPDLVVAE